MGSGGIKLQPWKLVDFKNARDLSSIKETWMQTLEDDKDLSNTSMGSCLQASVVMNTVVVRLEHKGVTDESIKLFKKLEENAEIWKIDGK